MTAYTATQNGDWTNAATWGGAGTPTADNDTATIPLGIVVDFDANTSALATGLGTITVNGTLRAKRAAGTYYLKLASTAFITLGASSVLDASDGAGGAYQSNASFTIGINGGSSSLISGTPGFAITMLCAEPTIKFIRLSSAAAALDTVLNVDTDITAEPYWVNGGTVRIDNPETTATNFSEERTIASRTATTITLTAGITAAKPAGSYITICDRNVSLLRLSGSQQGNAISANSTSLIQIAAHVRNFNTAFVNGRYTYAGGVWNGNNTAFTGATNDIPCVNTAQITGCGTSFSSGNSVEFTGKVSGCQNTFTGSSNGCIIRNAILCGNVSGTTMVFINTTFDAASTRNLAGSGATLINCILHFAVTAMSSIRGVSRLYNTLLDPSVAANEHTSYLAPNRNLSDYTESFDHDQVTGAFKAWAAGGVVVNVATPVFGSRPQSYDHKCEHADYPVYLQRDVWVAPGQSLGVICYVRKTASMAYLPRLWVFSADNDPFFSGTPNVEKIMTDSVDTWETLSAQIVNPSSLPKLYRVRTVAKNATGDVYFDFDTFVGSGVGRSRVVAA